MAHEGLGKFLRDPETWKLDDFEAQYLATVVADVQREFGGVVSERAQVIGSAITAVASVYGPRFKQTIARRKLNRPTATRPGAPNNVVRPNFGGDGPTIVPTPQPMETPLNRNPADGLDPQSPGALNGGKINFGNGEA